MGQQSMTVKNRVLAVTLVALSACTVVGGRTVAASEYIADLSGLYGGINFGHGVGRNKSGFVAGNARTTLTNQPHGALGGLQAGYNAQRGRLLLGLEADIQLSAQKDSYSCVLSGNCVAPSGTSLDHRFPWFATLRARAGFVQGPLLLYATGGAIYGRVEANIRDTNAPGSASFNSTRWGWTAGGGAEFQFDPNWSVKVEYLYADLGSAGGVYIPAFNRSYSTQFQNHIFRTGLNFNPGAKAGGALARSTARHDWSGSYAGLFAGYAIARNPSSLLINDGTYANERFTVPPAGFLGGLQAGTNWHRDRWLFGVEADVQGAFQQDDHTCVVGCFAPAFQAPVRIGQKLPWLATLRARGGITAGNVLIYATGGLAYGGIKSEIVETSVANGQERASFSYSNLGWVAGAGVEAALPGVSNLSVKAEYLFVDLGRTTDPFTINYDSVFSTSVRNHIFRIGVNRKLGAAN